MHKVGKSGLQPVCNAVVHESERQVNDEALCDVWAHTSKQLTHKPFDRSSICETTFIPASQSLECTVSQGVMSDEDCTHSRRCKLRISCRANLHDDR